MSRALIALAVLLLLVLAPPAGAAPDPQVLADGADCFAALPDGLDATCGVLYAHAADLLQPVVLSVLPIPADAPDLASGFTSSPGVEPYWSFSRASLYLGLGPIHWTPEGGMSYGGRGPADPLRLVPGMPLIGYWYLSADTAEISPLEVGTDSGGLGVLPCLTVEMQAVAGRFPVSDAPVIASGKTTMTVVSIDGSPDHPLPLEDPCPGSSGQVTARDVHEFRVEMLPVDPVAESLEHLVIRVLWHQFDPSGDPANQDKIVQREWNRRTGPEYRPRVVFPVLEPARVLEVAIAETDGVVGVSVRPKSPWGSWEFIADAIEWFERLRPDVTPAGLRFHVLDAEGNAAPSSTVTGPILRYYVGHGHHDERLNITYLWHPADEPDLQPGTYTLVFEADNLQGTATARAEIEYTYAPAAMREGPSPPVAVLILAIFGAALVATLGRTRMMRP